MARLFRGTAGSSGGRRLHQEALCWCSCTLRDAAVAVGCLYVVLGVVASIISYAFLFKLAKARPDEMLLCFFPAVFLWKVICHVFGLVSLIQILVSLCLVYGGWKRKMGFLLPWIVYAILCAAASNTGVIYFVTALLNGDSTAISSIAVLAVNVGVQIYFLLVVCAYRDCLKKPVGHEWLVDSYETSSAA